MWDSVDCSECLKKLEHTDFEHLTLKVDDPNKQPTNQKQEALHPYSYLLAYGRSSGGKTLILSRDLEYKSGPMTSAIDRHK